MKWVARALAACVLLGGLTLYALASGSVAAWLLLGMAATVSALVLLGLASPLSAVAVARRWPAGSYQVGDVLTMTLTVSSKRWTLWPYLYLVDQLPDALGVDEPRFLLPGLWSLPTTVHYRIPLVRRGVYLWDAVRVESGDLFGLFRRQAVAHAPGELIVWPATVALAPHTVPVPEWRQGATRPRLTSPEPEDLRGIRDYQPGDRLTHIHWKTSARVNRWKVKEFEPERSARVAVVLDYGAAFRLQDWETAIAVAASLVRYAWEQHQPCTLAIMDEGESEETPDAVAENFHTMMERLSRLPHEPLALPATPDTLRLSHMAVVTAPTRRDAWLPWATAILTVGPGELQSLDDLRRLDAQAAPLWRNAP
ncbi:MAG: DUF58 domain-containing protein [Firmicutes bacterium]|nr:DUF58 domain-containing protein [Bacillota bacterium]